MSGEFQHDPSSKYLMPSLRMNREAENPLQSRLKSELQNSEWLRKFKQLSDTLRYIKTEIP